MQPSFLFGAALALVISLVASRPTLAADSAPLARLLAEAWEYDLAEDPLWATEVGEHRANDRLPRERLEDAARRVARKREFLARLEEIDRAQLDRTDQINFDIFQRHLADQIAEHSFQSHLMPITNRSGFHIEFPELRRRVPLNSVQDYRNYIARLGAFRQYAEDHIELLREGIRRQMTLPAVTLEGAQEPIRAHIVDDPQRSLFFEPLRQFPDGVPPSQREELIALAKQAIATGIVPGYRAFLEFMEREYLPVARGSIAASALPKGREYYRHRVKRFTTLDLTPEEVHQRGLAEVARIRGEMEAAIKQTGFEGDFAAFVQHLRSEPKFYAASPEQLMKEVAYVLKRMDGQLPKLFGKLPRTPYGIREVPAYIAPRTTTAYYSAPTGDGTSAGFYYVNTYDLKSRPLYEIEALSLHEAVPGHHLQLALQQELTGLPKFRRFAGVTAFIEGWGLYSERLGLETGFYTDPYSNFGRLSYEMWRACRLVVDTGMHYLGWTREHAIEFMSANTALTLHNIRAEVDRYIAWPGQALAYKTGELKIRELRQVAETRLGPRFDVREFHDAVLAHGSVPLDVLEANIHHWLNESGKRLR
jgi:uncharacterized protein (DUF885 family)